MWNEIKKEKKIIMESRDTKKFEVGMAKFYKAVKKSVNYEKKGIPRSARLIDRKSVV